MIQVSCLRHHNFCSHCCYLLLSLLLCLYPNFSANNLFLVFECHLLVYKYIICYLYGPIYLKKLEVGEGTPNNNVKYLHFTKSMQQDPKKKKIKRKKETR